MRFHYNDGAKAVTWAKEHWHVAGFIAACVIVLGGVLASWGLLSERAGLAAVLASLVYVALTTWISTHDKRYAPPNDPRPPTR
jgi:hypothetical protein